VYLPLDKNYTKQNQKIRKMKKNTISIGALVAFIALFSTNPANAQAPDTVRVKTTTTETTTTTTRPVPVEAPPPAEEPAEEYRTPVRKTEFGIRYYPTFSSLDLRNYNGEVVQGNATLSNGYGVFLGHNFNRHVGLILEVDYNEISQKYKDRNLDRTVHINYLNIPVLLSLNTDKTAWVNWNFVVGPQFGLNVGSSVKTNGSSSSSDTLRAVVAVKQGDVGLAYGTGLEFALSKTHHVRLDVGFRGFYGLVDMRADQQSSNPDTYNVVVKATRKTYAAYIGITFGF
jgi:hypothetical protein